MLDKLEGLRISRIKVIHNQTQLRAIIDLYYKGHFYACLRLLKYPKAGYVLRPRAIEQYKGQFREQRNQIPDALLDDLLPYVAKAYIEEVNEKNDLMVYHCLYTGKLKLRQ